MFLRLALSSFILLGSVVARAQDDTAKSNQSNQSNQSSSQEPEKGARSDRETREIFFRTLNECRSRGAQEFGFLLFQKAVREEVGLDEAGAKAAREVLSKSRSQGDKLYEQLKHNKITADELKAEFVRVMAEADREMWKTLVDANVKQDRLVGLYVQLHKSPAVLNKIVAERVGVDEMQRTEMVAKKDSLEREMIQEASKENDGPGDRFRSWEKIQRKVDTAMSEMLSAEQRTKLEQLKGEAFEFEQFPFPPPGPPGRGRDSDRDRRGHEKSRDDKCCGNEMLANDR